MDLGGTPPGEHADAAHAAHGPAQLIKRKPVLILGALAALVLGYLLMRSRSASSAAAAPASSTTYPAGSGLTNPQTVDSGTSDAYQLSLQSNAQYASLADLISGLGTSASTSTTGTGATSVTQPAASGGHVGAGAVWGIAGNRGDLTPPPTNPIAPATTVHTGAGASWGGGGRGR